MEPNIPQTVQSIPEVQTQQQTISASQPSPIPTSQKMTTKGNKQIIGKIFRILAIISYILLGGLFGVLQTVLIPFFIKMYFGNLSSIIHTVSSLLTGYVYIYALILLLENKRKKFKILLVLLFLTIIGYCGVTFFNFLTNTSTSNFLINITIYTLPIIFVFISWKFESEN